jgi:hypothetical protein
VLDPAPSWEEEVASSVLVEGADPDSDPVWAVLAGGALAVLAGGGEPVLAGVEDPLLAWWAGAWLSGDDPVLAGDCDPELARAGDPPG